MSIDLFSPPEGVNRGKFLFLLWKRYFDTGWVLTSYVKYIIALFGISSLDVGKTLVIGFIYAIGCVFIGYFWYKYNFVEVDNEISNRFNLFMREMREMKEKVESK